MKADHSAEIAGKTYSVADLKDMAGKVITVAEIDKILGPAKK